MTKKMAHIRLGNLHLDPILAVPLAMDFAQRFCYSPAT